MSAFKKYLQESSQLDKLNTSQVLHAMQKSDHNLKIDEMPTFVANFEKMASPSVALYKASYHDPDSEKLEHLKIKVEMRNGYPYAWILHHGDF